MQCSVFIATSLDGFIARRDGSLDWLKIVEQPGEDYGYAKFAATVDTLVMGRGTYDVVVGFPEWAYAGKRVIVLTHRPGEARHGEEFFAGSVEELAARLERDGVRRVYVDGGIVIQQFLAAKLVDDLTISVIPVLLGDGLPLFAHSEAALALEGVERWPSGLVQLRYRIER